MKTTIPTWKTITLGLYKTPEEYREAMTSAGMSIFTYADQILDDITIETKDVDLVVVSVGDLGLGDDVSYGDICANAIEQGFSLCPAEVGPALRLQYVDQPKGESLYVGMEGMDDKDGDTSIFVVEHELSSGTLWLYDTGGSVDDRYSHSNRVVFVRPS